jgi:hypothetical protein
MVSILEEQKKLPENYAKFYIAEIMLAIEHLHEVGTLFH